MLSSTRSSILLYSAPWLELALILTLTLTLTIAHTKYRSKRTRVEPRTAAEEIRYTDLWRKRDAMSDRG